MINQISQRRFDALCYARQPHIRMIAKEVRWYEAFSRKILANIVFDRIDQDYGYVILGRDSKKIFRCISLGVSNPTVEEAEKKLLEDLENYRDDGNEDYPQGDEIASPNEILEPVVDEAILHQYFKILIYEPRYEAARNLIKEIVYSYIDPDGHYIKEFQTNGFDARLWELYLYVFLYNSGFEFQHGHAAPDFHVNWFGEELFLEAVTVNPSQNPDRPDPDPPETQEEIDRLKNDYLPIKYGSPLYSKLQKKYWEKEHVNGKPLVIAIHDFHMPGSMTWSHNALADYLYGIRVKGVVNEKGQIIPVVENVESHTWQGKTIPSNFFSQPDAENISAVLFTNSATITKFNRMGKLAGLGSKGFKFIRQGYRFNPAPDAYAPIPFAIDVDDDKYEESWSDSVIMYHNPNAVYPVKPEWFADISHFWWNQEEETLEGYIKEFDVIASMTVAISPHIDRPKVLDEDIKAE